MHHSPFLICRILIGHGDLGWLSSPFWALASSIKRKIPSLVSWLQRVTKSDTSVQEFYKLPTNPGLSIIFRMKLGKGLQWVERGDRRGKIKWTLPAGACGQVLPVQEHTGAPGHMLSPEDTGACKHQDTISATYQLFLLQTGLHKRQCNGRALTETLKWKENVLNEGHCAGW